MKSTLQRSIILQIILISILAYSAFATYQWITVEKSNKILMDYIITQTDFSIAIVGDMGYDISYLLDINASNDLLTTKLHYYLINIRVLTYSSMMLYKSTKEDRYLVMRTSMANLESFLLTTANSQDLRKILYNNIDKLRKISSIIKELITIEDITLEKAEKLLELTSNLEA